MYRTGAQGARHAVLTVAFVLLAASWAFGVTLFVTNVADSGPGSLRNAITMANIIPGQDTITFFITGSGVQTISVLSQLPSLTDTFGVVIDGLTQSGASSGPNPPETAVLMIEVNGASAGPSHGLHILSPNNWIQGLVIDTFQQDGIRIQGEEFHTASNWIFCNFIGTDPTGSITRGNGYNKQALWAGVDIIVAPCSVATYANDNFVASNLISGNYAEGVGISSCPPGDVYGNVVMENYIGTDISGTLDFGNAHDGVCISEGAHHNTVGNNIISGNGYEGVSIVGYAASGINTHDNMVAENMIGLNKNLQPLPNAEEGIDIGEYGTTYQGGYAARNYITGNTIAYNIGNGISVWEHGNSTTNADSNLIGSNSIYDNGMLGIDLGNDGVTPNDAGDPDTGPNQGLNFPVITSAFESSGVVTVSGTVDFGENPTASIVEVFKARPDPSGYGEGEVFLASIAPDVSGNWTVQVPGVTLGDTLTATAIYAMGNTSEFSGTAPVTTGIQETGSAFKRSKVQGIQCRPNPVSAWTEISYSLPVAGHVRLTVSDASGRLVGTLLSEDQNSGLHHVRWSAEGVSSGVYFFRLLTGESTVARKLVVLR
jgi:hypothetical protein